jgi:hypothetical protein
MAVEARVTPEPPATVETRRRSPVLLVTLRWLVALAVAATAGFFAPRVYDWLTLGATARSVATKLGCTGFSHEAQHHTGIPRYADSGTCTLGDAQLHIVTFATGTDGDVFDQVLAARLENDLATGRTASFASARGWTVSDSRFTRPVAQDVIGRMGTGVVNRVLPGAGAKPAPSAPARSAPARSAPARSASTAPTSAAASSSAARPR